MPSKITIETLLRDPDDCSGQTVRQWKIEIEGAHITLRHNHGDGFILIRAADVPTLCSDLERARDLADPYVIEAPKPPVARRKRRTNAEIAAATAAAGLNIAPGNAETAQKAGVDPEIPGFLRRAEKAE
jgi:hypothetical protein